VSWKWPARTVACPNGRQWTISVSATSVGDSGPGHSRAAPPVPNGRPPRRPGPRAVVACGAHFRRRVAAGRFAGSSNAVPLARRTPASKRANSGDSRPERALPPASAVPTRSTAAVIGAPRPDRALASAAAAPQPRGSAAPTHPWPPRRPCAPPPPRAPARIPRAAPTATLQALQRSFCACATRVNGDRVCAESGSSATVFPVREETAALCEAEGGAAVGRKRGGGPAVVRVPYERDKEVAVGGGWGFRPEAGVCGLREASSPRGSQRR
jgi:hypothetical protein